MLVEPKEEAVSTLMSHRLLTSAYGVVQGDPFVVGLPHYGVDPVLVL